jgi:PAS domain S-box-containing protein
MMPLAPLSSAAAPSHSVFAPLSPERPSVEVELRESQRTLETLMDNLPGMAYRCRNDPDWTMDFVSQGSLALTGYVCSDLVANAVRSYGDLILPEDRDHVAREVQAALLAKTNFRIAYRISPAVGPDKWVWEQGCGVFSSDGELQFLEGFITDITEARRAEENGLRLAAERIARASAESAEQRAEFLAEASRILGASFDYHTTLACLARLAVPTLADYCTVDVLQNDSDVMRLGVAHVDPAKEALLLRTVHLAANTVPGEHPISEALFEHRSTLTSEISGDASQGHAGQLQPRSSINVPLVISDRLVGALTLVISESDRRYTLTDVAFAEDLARRAALAVEHARLFQDAQQATQARDQVLAIVAHDLRNPLSTVLMAAQLLLETPTEKTDRKHLDIIRRSADRMNRLVQDLLEVTRIESGRLTVDARPEEVAPVIEEALSMLRPLAAGRSILLESNCDERIPPVLLDSARILQVFSNLIGNAIKFTPIGGSVSIRCERAGDEVRLGVSDTGPGIPAEELPHIFRRFWQASTKDRRGIGLGLSIAEGIVEAHGGRIWVESRPGVGSTFYFTRPLARSSAT